MTWVHVALAVLVTIIVLVIAVSRSYALGRESGERDTLAGQGSDSGSLFGTDVPVREAEQGLIDVMPSEVIVCDGNGSVRCSSKSQVNVDVIENGWIVKDGSSTSCTSWWRTGACGNARCASRST